MKNLLPLLLALVGLAGGVGAGIAFRPAPVPSEIGSGSNEPSGTSVEVTDDPHTPQDKTYVKLNNQFIVPVIGDRRVSALVALSLSVETLAGEAEAVYEIEPRLRDAFLQVLFDYANTGGFEGTFTDSNNMAILRRSLLEVAQVQSNGKITDILITDIARQDN